MKKILYTLSGLLLAVPAIASAQYGYGYGNNMMGYQNHAVEWIGSLFVICIVVWTVVGVLAAVWLWQHISKK